MIPENVLASLRQRFSALPAPVTIEYFQQSESGLIVPGAAPRTPCPACAPTLETLEDLVGVSPRLRLVTHEFHANPQLTENWGVEHVPATVLRRGGGGAPLRYYGMLGGHFFEVLVEVLSAWPAHPTAPAALGEVLDRLTEPLQLMVVGSLRHAAAAQAVATACQLALYSPRIDLSIVEVETFPEIAQQFALRELPATIVAGRHGFTGVTTSLALAQFGVEAQQSGSPAPPQIAPGSASPIGGAQAPDQSATPQQAPAPPPPVEPAADRVDVAIVGGGPAGLQAALVLVRARKSVALFDAPSPPRNAASHGVHNFLGVEGMLPDELARTAREQIEAVGGAALHSVEVTNVERASDGGLVLTTGEGDRLSARHVILAFGHRDAIPDVPGFDECWGTSVISCPFCDGYEHRDRTWGLVVPSTGAKATPPLFAQNWTDKMKIIVGGSVDFPDEVVSAVEAQGISVHRGDITAITHEDGALTSVTLDGGETVEVETLLWSPETLPTPLVGWLGPSLGLALDEDGFIATNPMQQTSVEGIWAAGDATGSTMALDAARSGGAVAMLIVQGWFEEQGH